MNWSEFIEIISILLFASVKFFYAPPLALKLGYSILDTSILLCIGGITGVLFFYFGGGAVSRYIGLLQKAWYKKEPKPKKKFTKLNKLIVRVRKKFGVTGIAIITPPIISIPIGCIIAYKLYSKKKSTIVYLISSVIIWSFIVSPFWAFLLRRVIGL